MSSSAGAPEQHTSFCRICEAVCGIVATVEDGRVVRIEGDPDHPLSRGYLCVKGAAMVEVQNDPDRVLQPLRRTGGPGEFTPVSWEVALDDIVARARHVKERHGGASLGWYMGNPAITSIGHPLWIAGFLAGLASHHFYSSASQDVSSRHAASQLLYGNGLRIPIPDLRRTQFLLMVGANPLVSHGSMVVAPRFREHLDRIVDRGGRVVVVDPRRTETARRYEHQPIRADSDAWLLLALVHVIFSEGLVDEDFLGRHTTGVSGLAELASQFPPEAAAAPTGIAPDRIRSLARSFASAESAAAYGRVGSCVGSFGTLVVALLDALNVVTGNLHRPGGSVFGRGAVPMARMAKRSGIVTYDTHRSRVGDIPEVLGVAPGATLAAEITTPGDGQLRALFLSAGNPLLTVPDARALEEALGELELLVSLDLYLTETNRHAHYILPATTWLERPDAHTLAGERMVTPFTQATRAVVPPAGEAREEWQVIELLARRLGVLPYKHPLLRRLARLGLRPTPRHITEVGLRLGPAGNRFGLRPGRLTLGRLERQPHGVVLGDDIPTGRLRRFLDHKDHKVHLVPELLAGEARRLTEVAEDPRFPLRLVGLRQMRSHNSWMHNAPRLMGATHRQELLVHPDDAGAIGLTEGGDVRLSSKSGSVVVPVHVSDEMTPGNVALPHGWGHQGGWRRANQAGGVNVNLLTSSDVADIERLAGMSHLTGVPVRIDR